MTVKETSVFDLLQGVFLFSRLVCFVFSVKLAVMGWVEFMVRFHVAFDVHHIHGVYVWDRMRMDYGMDHGHFWELSEAWSALLFLTCSMPPLLFGQSPLLIILPRIGWVGL
jgi:hypothetical protein